MFVICPISVGQISPGDLIEAHAHLEGISNCTKCHTLGEKISNNKCLDCHEPLKKRIEADLGYHASVEIKGKECISCHSDHHGRNFEVIRFDEENFDHLLTGHELEGKHARIDCRECHKADFITDETVRSKDYTFLGLETSCLSCHEDYHQATLASTCTDCHTQEAFEPASLFDHNDTDFILDGKHETLDCNACHKNIERNGQKFQEFAGIAFSSCASCHEDVHKGQLGNSCSSCHSTTSFHLLNSMKDFNHNRTNFPLKGQHQYIDCRECHIDESKASNQFQEFIDLQAFDCALCHEDVHINKFGNQCQDCHSEDSFRMFGEVVKIDHNKTDYELLGKHNLVDCRSCHKDRMIEPLEHDRCSSCHNDYHDNQFAVNGISPDCADCHTVFGFESASFTIEQHNAGSFPLEGAHLATPCFECHMKDEGIWQFKDIGRHCVDCHNDIHENIIDASFYPDQDCRQCHTVSGWNEVQFDHERTDFSLEGRHARISCSSCHMEDVNDNDRRQLFSGLSHECTTCHLDVHYQQFDIDGSTDCNRCHGFTEWQNSTFDHNNSRFILEGKHAEIDCVSCHGQVTDGVNSYVQYKFESIACSSCHL
jgi:hypothetical protein